MGAAAIPRDGEISADWGINGGIAGPRVASWRPIVNARIAAPLVILLAFALRLHDAGLEPFWKNELFTMAWIRQPVGYLLGEGMRVETNPPLHFLLLKGWIALVGDSEFAARLPSVLAATAAVALTLRLGRETLGPAPALLGGLLLALMPVQILYAHEARAYALLTLFAPMAMLGAHRLIAAAARPAATPSWSAAALMAVGMAGMMHAHATGLLAAAAIGLAGLATLPGTAGAGAASGRMVAGGLAALLIAAPVLWPLLHQSGSDNIAWMPRPGLDTPFILSRFLLVGPMVRSDLGVDGSSRALFLEMITAAGTAALLIGLGFRTLRDAGARAMLLIAPLLFIALAYGVSLARPILLPRVTLWLGAPIALVVAAILLAPGARPVRALAATAFGLCLAVGLWNNLIAPAQHKPDWPALVALHPPGEEGPMLVAGPHAGPLGYIHYGALAPDRLRHWTPDPARPATTADRLERRLADAAPIDTAAIAAAIEAGRKVVLYLDDDDEILIAPHLEPHPWFARARRVDLPGLIVLSW